MTLPATLLGSQEHTFKHVWHNLVITVVLPLGRELELGHPRLRAAGVNVEPLREPKFDLMLGRLYGVASVANVAPHLNTCPTCRAPKKAFVRLTGARIAGSRSGEITHSNLLELSLASSRLGWFLQGALDQSDQPSSGEQVIRCSDQSQAAYWGSDRDAL